MRTPRRRRGSIPIGLCTDRLMQNYQLTRSHCVVSFGEADFGLVDVNQHNTFPSRYNHGPSNYQNLPWCIYTHRLCIDSATTINWRAGIVWYVSLGEAGFGLVDSLFTGRLDLQTLHAVGRPHDVCGFACDQSCGNLHTVHHAHKLS